MKLPSDIFVPTLGMKHPMVEQSAHRYILYFERVMVGPVLLYHFISSSV